MLNYAIVEIKGKQYLVTPNKPLTVNHLGDDKSYECDRVLLRSDNEKLEIGSPYLKDKLNFTVLETVTPIKIRVAKFHAKANYRRVSGSKQKYTKIVLSEPVKKA